MGGLPLHKLVAATFTGALTYGLYIATLLIWLRWLLFKRISGNQRLWRKASEIRWTILLITFLIFACNTVYVALVLQETMQAALEATTGVEPPEPNQIAWRSMVICTTANTVVLLADSVLIYRTYMLYGRTLPIILFPTFFWLAALVCTILQLYLQIAHTHNSEIGPYSWARVSMNWGPGIVLLPFWICSVLVNGYSTVALIRRIYGPARSFKGVMSVKHLHLAIRIIAESGLLNLSITLAHLLVWFGKEEFPVTIIGMLNAPLTGIAFNWFLLRFEQTKADHSSTEVHSDDYGGGEGGLDGSSGMGQQGNLTTIQFNSSLSATLEEAQIRESPLHFISLGNDVEGLYVRDKDTVES